MGPQDFGDDISTFGDRLTYARDALGMDEAQLAKRLGVNTSTIIKWENNQSEPRANRLYMMCGLLNISVMWLITGEGEAPSDHSDPKDINIMFVRSTIAKLRKDMVKMQKTIDALEASL